MNAVKALGIFILGMAVEWLWSACFPVFGLSPCVLLILTIAMASCAGPLIGQCYGFFWGLFLDVLSAHAFGAGALALTLVGYFVGILRRQMDVSSPTSQIMVVAVVSIAAALFVGLAGLVFERHFLWAGWGAFIGGILYNCLVAPAIFALVRKTLER
ncbi:MAG: rod shape-determining protein MreD [Elusimicrobia bacterium]|nr:rod shape-determining protein MreD [Elusimicrobiota bacterium]